MNAYQRAEMDRMDFYRGLNVARQEGRTEGRTEGEIEGEKNKQLEVSRKMVGKGFEDAVIQEVTEISLAELSRIRKES